MDMAEGRSSGFRINLIFAPSHLIRTKQWYLANFVPVYSGGTAPELHGISYKALLGTLVNGTTIHSDCCQQKNEVAFRRRMKRYWYAIHLYNEYNATQQYFKDTGLRTLYELCK
jgi:hypothetical protein